MRIYYTISFLLLSLFLKAQNLNCTNIFPDDNISISFGSPITYDLDINLDGINDYRFTVTTFANSFGGASSATIEALDSNMVMGDTSSLMVYELGTNDSITDTSSFFSSPTVLLNFSFYPNTHYGLWQNYGPPRYCGVKFYGNSKWHYGYVTLSVESAVSHSKIIFYEYCYSENPILAGEGTTVSINNYSNNIDFQLFPNPCKEFIKININTKHIGSKYYIYNAFGLNVQTGTIENNENTINIINLSSGVYSINVGGKHSKRFIVTN